MPLGHFHHIVLDVSDLERSAQFYGDALGLDPAPLDTWPDEGGAPKAIFKTDIGQYVVLVQLANVKPDGPAQHTNFIVSPEAYERIYERLKARGCLVADHLVEQGRRPIGELSTYLDDPDGRRLQITAYTGETFALPAAKKGKVVAGRVEDFPIGTVVHNAEGKFFLVRLDEGILALNQVCTHQHCLVTYQPEHYRFWCPCHNRKFDRKGEQIAISQDVPPLNAYDVEFVDGQVVVDTDTTIPRTIEEAQRMVTVPVQARGGVKRDGSH